ncbi:acetyl-coenzyme A synthetase N-terminal domain-containing protein [Streptomyces sp. NPDC001093]|uniref:acetyl-coenzyme A synthetase N-terminal domain-containing protein n=1 Tax=Streptomyces sp. NPDC001093 TaxID=3154376 RepID=UPI0033227D29
MTPDTELLWTPGRRELEDSNVAVFMEWLEETRGLRFADYAELWRWSSTDLAGFWSAVWEYYGLDAVTGYDEVLGEATIPGARWFTGARLNFAERCPSTTPVTHATGPATSPPTRACGGTVTR